MSKNRVIGRDNKLPWHLPADLKHFKKITSGHPIFMGRKTFESIGKALPNRLNIVLSRDPNYVAPGCVVVNSIEEALLAADKAEVFFVIGGAMLFDTLLPQTDKIFLTVVEEEIEGDTYFPSLEDKEWIKTAHESHPKDAENEYPYTFYTLDRIKPI